MKIRAFTLIELLIVVGIIAILALIALPNMLEAQIRAKVSRVKSDLRTVITGLETYHVDNNHYPTYHYVPNTLSNTGFSFHVGGTVTAIGNSPPFPGPNPLTSPVAYLTAFPVDVFGGRGPADPREGDQFYYVNWDYAVTALTAFHEFQQRQGSWRLHSPGPDKFGPDSVAGTGESIHYEPTNGSVSGGDIVRIKNG